jgi:hypothetical protein
MHSQEINPEISAFAIDPYNPPGQIDQHPTTYFDITLHSKIQQSIYFDFNAHRVIRTDRNAASRRPLESCPFGMSGNQRERGVVLPTGSMINLWTFLQIPREAESGNTDHGI